MVVAGTPWKNQYFETLRLKKPGKVRDGIVHEGFRTIIYKHVGNTTYTIYSDGFLVFVAIAATPSVKIPTV